MERAIETIVVEHMDGTESQFVGADGGLFAV